MFAQAATEMQKGDNRETVTNLLQGYRATCLLVTGVQLGLFERLGRGELQVTELSESLGAHLPSLRRFLCGLEVLGIIQCNTGGVRLTALGTLLLEDTSALADRALLIGEEYLPAWQNLRHAVLSGESAFDDQFGMSTWAHREQHPMLNRAFNRIMADDQRQTEQAIVAAYDFSRSKRVIDVGGGHGHLLVEILRKHVSAEGVLFDQAHVLESVESSPGLREIRNRLQFVAGNFLNSVPADGDIYLLQHILHDWHDAQCVTILKNCRSAMKRGSRLLLIENLLPSGMTASEGLVMLDLHMMAVLGGRERRQSEFELLLQQAGFAVQKCIRTDGKISILECD